MLQFFTLLGVVKGVSLVNISEHTSVHLSVTMVSPLSAFQPGLVVWVGRVGDKTSRTRGLVPRRAVAEPWPWGAEHSGQSRGSPFSDEASLTAESQLLKTLFMAA